MAKHDNKDVHREKRKKMKLSIGWTITLVIAAVIVYFVVTAPRAPASEFESTTGLHYHSHLIIIIDGEEQTLPSGLGLSGPTESPLHIHEADNIVHMEFTTAVKKEEIRLQRLFDLWNKEWTATSFMGFPLDGNHTLTMKVNGTPSTEYGSLLMQDKQEITLEYK